MTHWVPTNMNACIFLGENGNRIGETGYRQGGAAKYAEHLMGFRKK